MRFIFSAIALALTAGIVFASPMVQHGMMAKGTTDASKIKSALSAGPASVTKNAAVYDWPTGPGAAPKQLRAGTNGWACYPSMTATSRDPMCLDAPWQALITAVMSKTALSVSGPGIAYMLQGDTGVSNTSPYDTAPTATNSWVISPPHVMILFPDTKQLDAFPTDPNNGGPWVMWKGTPYVHLMVPVAGRAKVMPASSAPAMQMK